MCLVPAVADACDIPVIAAGGLHDGRSIIAAMMLGAEAVQLGSRFVAHRRVPRIWPSKRRACSRGRATSLELKDVTPVRTGATIRPARDGGTAIGRRSTGVAGAARTRPAPRDVRRRPEGGELEIGQITAMLQVGTCSEPGQAACRRCRSLGAPRPGGPLILAARARRRTLGQASACS